MLLIIVSGNSSRKLDVITLSGDFTSMPTMIHIHDTEIAKTMISATARTTPTIPAAGRNPMTTPRVITIVAASE